MKCKSVISCVIVTCLCLAGTATAQEQVFAGAGQAFQASSGLVGGFDVLFLRAYGDRYDQFVHAALPLADATPPSNDFEISPRVWLGYVGESGFGMRGRWFQYQHDLKAGTGVFEDWPEEGLEGHARNYLDVYAVDIEFMQQVDLGCWDANAGAGIRAGGVKRRSSQEAFLDGASEGSQHFMTRFEGVGPTVFAELRRPIMGTRLSLIANARGSILFGDHRAEAQDFDGDPMTWKTHGVVAVGEIQLGAEYARELGYGATGFVQCLWEGQLWTNVSELPVPLPDRDDLGLMGVAFNFGIAR